MSEVQAALGKWMMIRTSKPQKGQKAT